MITRQARVLFAQELGNRIKAHRKNTNQTQDSLARAVGLHQAAFSRIESGKQDITVFEIFMLCQVLKIRISVLLNNLNLKKD